MKRFELRSVMAKLDLRRKWPADSSLTEHELRMPLRAGIEMKGKADRIDVIDGNCIVVDYKSGNANNVRDLISDGARFQGPLYALAASSQLGLTPIAMVYWALKNGKLYGWGDIPGIDLEPMPPQWMETARDRVLEELDLYLAGAIPAHPTNAGLCNRCDFRTGCRVSADNA